MRYAVFSQSSPDAQAVPATRARFGSCDAATAWATLSRQMATLVCVAPTRFVVCEMSGQRGTAVAVVDADVVMVGA